MSETSFQIYPVTLSAKPLFDSYFKSGCFLNSEFTFTNMFMWQKPYNIRYAEIDNTLCIFSQHNNEPESVNFISRSGDITSAMNQLLEYFKQKNIPPVIRLFGKEQKGLLKETFPGKFYIERDIDNFDYVYQISDLTELSGSKYHAKRNHINKFKSLYDFKYRTLTPEFREPCREMFARWCESKRESLPNVDEQLTAVNTLLDNWENLDITGGALFIDDRIIAFSFGEVLCSDQSIIVVHLEHADTDFQGSYPMINQQFLINEWSDFTLVNREEDMGLEGLRKAKKSYYPTFMVKKYIATLK